MRGPIGPVNRLLVLGFKKKVMSALLLMLVPTTFLGFVLPYERRENVVALTKKAHPKSAANHARLSGFKARIHQQIQAKQDVKMLWMRVQPNKTEAGFARVGWTGPETAAMQTALVGGSPSLGSTVKYLGSLPSWPREIFALLPTDSSKEAVSFVTVDKAGHFVPLGKHPFFKNLTHLEVCGSTEDELVIVATFEQDNQFYVYTMSKNADLHLRGKTNTSFTQIANKVLSFGEKSLLSIHHPEVRLHEFTFDADGKPQLSERILETPAFIDPDLAISIPYARSLALLMHNQKRRTMQVLAFHDNAESKEQLINLDNDEKWDNLVHIPNSNKTILYKGRTKLFADHINILSSDVPDQWVVEQTLSSGRYMDQIIPVGDKSISDANFFPLSHSSNPIRVLHATLEYLQSEVGGIAAVTKTLIPHLNRGTHSHAVVAQVIMPKFAFLKFPDAKLEEVALVEHYYKNKWVRSAVLRASDHLLVVEPLDANHKNIFQVSDKNGLYTDEEEAAPIERWLYFDSAVASFVSQFKDPVTHQPFHVLHMHSYHTSVAGELLDIYQMPRAQAGLPKPKTVFHMHALSYDQGWIKGELLAGLGLETKSEWENLTKRTLEKVDMAVTVSRNMYEDGSSEKESLSYGLKEHFHTLAKSLRIKPVLNGINTAQWDPRDKRVLAADGEDLTFSAENIQEGKDRIKAYLKKRKYFDESNRPLVTFVGRFSDEKGIEHLESAAREVIKLGGNFAIMGSYGKSYNSRERILNLKELAHGAFAGRLLVIDTVEAQKEDNLGMLVRAASDFSFVPSREETCGLVPLEFFSVGALTITSYVGGLRDTVIPYSAEAAYYNGFIFNYDDTDQLFWTINQAFKVLGSSKMAAIRQKVMKDSQVFDWSTPGGAVSQIIELYKKLVEQ